MVRKALLIVVPFLFLGMYILFNPIKSVNNNLKDQNNYIEIKDEIERFNIEEFITRIEKYTHETNLNVYKIKHLFNQIEFELHGDIEDIVEFLTILEKKESLVQIKLMQMYIDKIKFNLEVGKKLNQFEGTTDLKRSYNPFIFNIMNEKFTLMAIIENSAIIDKNLVHVGDVYKKYRVYKIEEKSVVLRNKEKQIILRINDA